MITTKHRVKLIAFVVIGVVSIAYVAVNYAGLGAVFGTNGYVVSARFDEPGGIFVGAEVTYRGVAVGSVSDMHLTDDGLAVELTINSDAPPIPTDTAAAVSNRSPIGEQYVDLRPSDETEPYLSGGEVIPNERTSVPVPSSEVLLNLNELVNSVNRDSLRTIVDEAYQAFSGTGHDLQVLLDNANSFSKTALRNVPQTQELFADSRKVLQTQLDNSENLTTLAGGFAEIADQLKKSDPDLRTIVDEAPGLSKEIRGFLAESGSDMGILFANLLTTTRITSKRTDSLEMLLVALPLIPAQSTSRAPHGNPRLGVALNFFDPPSCTKGYDTKQRAPTDLSHDPPNFDAYCAEPPGSQTGVRGAQNAPYAGKPTQLPEQAGNTGSPQTDNNGSDQTGDDNAERKASDTDGETDDGAGQGGLPGTLGKSSRGEMSNSVDDLLGAGG